MSSKNELPKAYDASQVEDRLYREWEASGAFAPQGDGEPYCIVMPPPNRTGTLHMGHASMLAIEDLLIRFHRMQGKRAWWIPGTDHAAIATQVKVEQLLINEGMKNPREELGREKFLERVVEFAENSAQTIRTQIRKMGSSCDWNAEKYTLDEDRSRAVNAMFKMMVDDGLIELGFRVVNWDPQFQTTLSDDEVETKETTAKLYTFKYDADFPIAISTTRPETKFGDTAVAVHPDDERYQKYIGKKFSPTFCGKILAITVIADASVDPNFGTGALGVTPAHSKIDEEIAERHGLVSIPVIGRNAKMLPEAGPEFFNLTIKAAREKIESMLREAGLLENVEDVPQSLPIAQRGGAIVEQLPMQQWFIRVNKEFALRQDALGKWKKGEKTTLKELMRYAVESKQANIVPERFEKIYFHWIDNLRDWCISRQIWFGHRIPVWYSKAAQDRDGHDFPSSREWRVADQSPGTDWEQDSDTLDTWFSSGLWTFSTLGWPDQEAWKKNREFHPTAVLETGYDILFFWVARMMLMSTYAFGEVPFKDVYLHGLVRDEQGRKMSKSLGNVLDPLDLIPKYGTDAVRLSLVLGTTPGQDVKLSEAKIEGFRNFTNKLWNISRFILMQIGDADIKNPTAYINETTIADRWILLRLRQVTESVSKKLEACQFSSAGEELRDFTWADLADWYLEVAKIEGRKELHLAFILNAVLRLWHPFMPFVTEELWQKAGFQKSCMVSDWPRISDMPLDDVGVEKFELLRTLVTDIRRLRAERGVEPALFLEAAFVTDEVTKGLIETYPRIVQQLARLSSVSFVPSIDSSWATAVFGSITIGLNIGAIIDTDKERAKLQKEIEDTEAYIASQASKFHNKEFVAKAPKEVLKKMTDKIEEAKSKLSALKDQLKALG